MKTNNLKWLKHIAITLLFPVLAVQFYSGGTGGGTCLSFDGVNDWVDTPLNFDLDVENQTICMWVKINDLTQNRYFLFSVVSVGNDYCGLIHRNDKGGIVLQHDTDWLFNGFFTTPSQNILANSWTHVVLVRGSGNNVKIYQNGVKISDEDLQETNYNPDNIQIARCEAGFNNYFNGQIDEVTIWNRALTQEEIRKNMCQKLKGNESGLVGYWRFDEASGSTVYDASGNGNDGTLY